MQVKPKIIEEKRKLILWEASLGFEESFWNVGIWEQEGGCIFEVLFEKVAV
jgi:hypothetical protein